jgi:uroporphyrinogen-III synthase
MLRRENQARKPQQDSGTAGGLRSTEELAGTRVLVGRARSQAGKLSEALRQRGAEVMEIPFLEIREPRSWAPLDEALGNLGSYEWLILTSVNGVKALLERCERLGISDASLTRLRIAAIGPATEAAIRARGLEVEVVPERYVAESVVSALRDQVRGQRVLLVRARVARDVIPRELKTAGAQVDVVEAYETVLPEGSRKRLQELFADEGRRPQVVCLTSSSSVRNLMELAGRELVERALEAGVRLASIGPVTSATLGEYGLPVHIEAREYTIPGLVEMIVEAGSGTRTP